MANGKDSEDKFVGLSEIRVGLKRGFEFALKAQSEICGSLGRTPARKVQGNVDSGSLLGSSEVKKLKTYESRKKRKREEQSVVVKEKGVTSEEEKKSDVDVNNKRERPLFEKDDKNDSEHIGVGKKEVLMNVAVDKVVNEPREVKNDKFGKVVVDFEEENNGCDKVSITAAEVGCEEVDQEKGVNGGEDEKKNGCYERIHVDEDKCEVDHGMGGNDFTGEENNEFEEVVSVAEEEKKNDSYRVAMDVQRV